MEILATCHVHSSWSYDGSWSLKDLASRFKDRGCRVVMMTEHDRGFSSARLQEYREACAGVSSEEILLVPGIEYSDPANRVHVLVWGELPFLGESLPTPEMLRRVKAANGIAVFAHPSRRNASQCFEPEWAELLLGIEVWNRKYDGWAPSETAGSLIETSGAVPFVGLDFHTQRQSFPLAMALELASSVTEAAVLCCLRSRHCEARVFGAPLMKNSFQATVPLMRAAERGRRVVAQLAKKSGVLYR